MDKNSNHWHSALGSLKARISYAYHHNQFVDVTFLVGPDEEEISANQTILSLQSPVMAACFSPRWTTLDHGDQESGSGSGDQPLIRRIKLPDLKPVPFRAFLKFLYTEELDTSLADVGQLLYISRKYQTDDLTKACYYYLEKNITKVAANQLLQDAKSNYDEKMEEIVFQFIAKDGAEYLLSDAFLALSLDDVQKFLDLDGLVVPETLIFKRAMDWVDEAERKNSNPNNKVDFCKFIRRSLLTCIRFGQLSLEEFLNDVVSLHILNDREENDILKYITSSMTFVPTTGLGHQCKLKCRPRSGPKRTRYVVMRVDFCGDDTVYWSGNGKECNHCHPGALVSCGFFGMGRDQQLSNNLENQITSRMYKIDVSLQNLDRDITYGSTHQEGKLESEQILFGVFFDKPIPILPGIWYNIHYKYTGPHTLNGNADPKYTVQINRENKEPIEVKFKDAKIHNAVNQLPKICFEF